MNNRYYIFILLFISLFLSANRPVVAINLPALLGNRLWGFCVAKIIATELNYDLHCKPIYGFPNTYSYQESYPPNNYGWEINTHDQEIDIDGIIQNKNDRNIRLKGYFQRYSYIEKYADIIRNDWLKIDSALLHKVDPEDIVVHIRFHVGQTPMKFEYYQQALAMAHYKQVYICTEQPNHPFLKNFDPYNPIIVSTRDFEAYFHNISWDETTKLNVDDFGFMASFNKIIISYSTYAWWAAFLSNATEIYAPWSSTGHTHYGKVNEPRYTYIDTQVILRTPLIED